VPRDAIDGFSFEGQGTLDRVDTFTAKSGKNILTLVLRVGGQYPQLIPVKVFGRTADEAGEWHVGNVLRVSGRLGGREWNGKVYGDIVATHVHVAGQGSAAGAGQQQLGTLLTLVQHREEIAAHPEDSDDVPF
jgi:single-stranded DNA-binding protein